MDSDGTCENSQVSACKKLLTLAALTCNWHEHVSLCARENGFKSLGALDSGLFQMATKGLWSVTTNTCLPKV